MLTTILIIKFENAIFRFFDDLKKNCLLSVFSLIYITISILLRRGRLTKTQIFSNALFSTFFFFFERIKIKNNSITLLVFVFHCYFIHFLY